MNRPLKDSIKNSLRSGISVFKANILGISTPNHILFSVTNKCPNNCVYCYCEKEDTRDLSTNEVKSIIAQAALMGCRTVLFLGGEPLLRDDIVEVARYSKDKGLYVSLSTSGCGLDKKCGLLDVVDQLCVSFDGPEEMHDANRGKGSFVKAMRAIELASGKTSLSTNTVITKNNIKAIDHIIAKGREYGFSVNFVIARGCDESIIPGDEEHRSIVAHLIEEKKNGAPIPQSFAFLETLLSWPDYRTVYYNKSEIAPRVKCYAGSLYCYINSNGDVYPCGALIGKTKPMNCIRSGFKEAFNNSRTAARDCGMCLCTSYLESNYVYSLGLSAVVNRIKGQYFR